MGELLSQVCSEVKEAELMSALQGLLAAAAHVRAAATVALLDVPVFAESKYVLSVFSYPDQIFCIYDAHSCQAQN